MRRRAPHSVAVIERCVGELARDEGIVVGRLQRWVQLMVLLTALDRVRDDRGEPLFLVKGGVAMELRLGLGARATKDLDAVFRDAAVPMLACLDEALRGGWGEFSFQRSVPQPIGPTGSLRFEVKLSYRGRRWGTVPLEVAPAEGGAGGDVEQLDAISIAPFGLEGLERVPGLGVRYQIAQKLHACTQQPPVGREENQRVHDLIDLLLLCDLVGAGGWPAVRSACLDTFAVRGTHAWPPQLVVYPSWPGAYALIASQVGFALTGGAVEARRVGGRGAWMLKGCSR